MTDKNQFLLESALFGDHDADNPRTMGELADHAILLRDKLHEAERRRNMLHEGIVNLMRMAEN